MSQENVKAVQRIIDFINQGELDPILYVVDEVTDPEVVLRAVGGPRDEPVVWRGRQSVRKFLLQMLGGFQWHVEVEQFIDADDKVVVCGRQTVRGWKSDVDVASDVFGVYGFRNGKVIYVDIYRTKSEAFEAARLSE